MAFDREGEQRRDQLSGTDRPAISLQHGIGILECESWEATLDPGPSLSPLSLCGRSHRCRRAFILKRGS
jgi:hypothetical protein